MDIHMEGKQLTVAYRQGEQLVYALRDVDLTVPRGQWLAVVGQNGSGKSTLARVLAGLCPLSRGQLRIAPRRVGMVFQDPNAQLVGQTVCEDIAFGLENIGVPWSDFPRRAQAALRRVGLDVPLHTPVEVLSGGQKQLLCVASTLAMEPAAVVFDEVTAMQSPRLREHLLQLADALRRSGVTIIWVTQFLEELIPADAVLALATGRVAYHGEVRAFFRRQTEVPEDSKAQSPCERLGLIPPFIVQTAHHLQDAGLPLDPLPLTAEELAEAVANA
ncbi:ATP-binding cassette domain-containing protein [Alicyclobacillus contaminans]|uniref:ATP-binding cassette domain-containing protein n=1 Tax=Alicyclobacillus contaminans TaxID=392016 RepID=UPI00040F21AA|nr:ATP-binding cassette domain-containing protein [Alicyclobacillus contaminans]